MIRNWRSLSFVCLFLSMSVFGLGAIALAEEDSTSELRAGMNYIETPVYPLEEDLELLELYEELRVADVSDGMDKVGLQNVGLMDSEILPLWKDTEHYTHRIVGVAVTARYVPTQRAPYGMRDEPHFDPWHSHWYNAYSSEPFVPILREGSVLVLDDASGVDVGSIGSNNIMGWALRGNRGVITNAGARDTDEIITQRNPLYLRHVSRGIRPGRNEIESVNRPIVCGGVLVMPGDIIVADGDGVIVVPRTVAREVAEYALEVLEGDKETRRALYERLGLPEDDSVR